MAGGLRNEIQGRVRANEAAMKARIAARRAAAQTRSAAVAERMHTSVAHTEGTLSAMGNDVLHQFQDAVAHPDQIRSKIESAVKPFLDRAAAAGAHVNVQNTGGQTKIGRS